MKRHARAVRWFASAGAAATLAVAPAPAALDAQNAAGSDARQYWVYVANESSDLISLVRFGPDGAVEEKTVSVGMYPADIEGAHGLAVSPSGNHWFVSTAHGTPYGKIWRFEAGTDRLVDSVTVGLFPATMSVTPDGSTLYVVNFNLHGDPIQSSVSAVFTPFMSEIRQIPTCVMPHGSRMNRDGSRHYSTCMMSDQLVEIATDRMEVNRRLLLTKGEEHVLHHDHAEQHSMGPGACKPTWATLDPSNEHVYVPCNGRGEVLEIDIERFAITRTFSTGAGPYNADVSPDGQHLVVTLKSAQGVAIVDLASGKETRVPTSEPVTHGVTISPDSRYAFISNEARGATRGTLDVIDLGTKRRVASVPLQYQSGGIAFWKMEPASGPTTR